MTTLNCGTKIKIRERKEMKKGNSLISIVFLVLWSSTSSRNTKSDSCSSQLSVNITAIPFNTSSLTCVSMWSSEDFILRYTKAGSSLWNFLLSAPDSGAYIAIGFSPSGGMVGSSAVAGWLPGGGAAGIVKQYYLGGYSWDECLPGNGSLPLVNGCSLLLSQRSRLYLAFQLNTAQPLENLVYAVGPSNTLPSPGGFLVTHRNMASGTRPTPGAGNGQNSGEGSDHGGGGTHEGGGADDGGNSNGEHRRANNGSGWRVSSPWKNALLIMIIAVNCHLH